MRYAISFQLLCSVCFYNMDCCSHPDGKKRTARLCPILKKCKKVIDTNTDFEIRARLRQNELSKRFPAKSG